jgi:membrane protease YdiL (CAAX protease family)
MLPVVAIGATLLAHNVLVHRVLPPRFHPLAGAVTTGVIFGLSRAAGATVRELGLEAETFGRGIRVGSAAGAAVGTGITAAMLLPAGRRYFARSAPATTSKRRMAYDTAIRIPWMTAAFEEMAFRGVLYGLLEHRFSKPVALAGSTAAFAAWHVLPALPGAGGVQDTWDTSRPALAVLGSVAVTGAAGLAFGLLRAQTGSVVAPFLVHSATNVGGYTAAVTARALERRGDVR